VSAASGTSYASTTFPDHAAAQYSARFVAAVTNPYFPLAPGTTFTYSIAVDAEPQDVSVTVTHDTKMILGVSCTLVHEMVTQRQHRLEDNLLWYAQDKDGNVWFFGEQLKKFENGQVKTDGAWEAGVDDAQPGFIVKGHPQVGEAGPPRACKSLRGSYVPCRRAVPNWRLHHASATGTPPALPASDASRTQK